MSAVIKLSNRYRPETSALALAGWEAFIADTTAPSWVQALRKRSGEKVRMMGLPTPKLERFKYTNIPAYLKMNSLAFSRVDMTIGGHKDYASDLLMSFDQDFVQEMLEVAPAGEGKYGDLMLWDFANSLIANGVVIDVPQNTMMDMPINIGYEGEGGHAYAPRQIIRVGNKAQVTIIEHHTGGGAYWHNGVTQIHIAKGAKVIHYRLQESSHESLHTQNTHVEIEQGGTYETFTLTLGAKTSRNQIHVDLLGSNAEVFVNGINLLKNKQLGDATITVEHKAPHCVSKQNYRNVVAGQAVGVFQGKVHVHQIAQKTDGYQFAKSLLLSPLATMNTKPELEIYADDVKCSHGTTSGQMDADALFYMRARGISQSDSERLLIEAFIAEVIEEISNDDMKERVALCVNDWLSKQVVA
ncbi:MAG: Fe-S cluster assembly protein SufD [Alphaproteobacteria bacterium]|nr:Fe-S cluster assembly protein SufD [Alphaproteobacteria bacterium]NCQ87888.1 Fe-S cluster assembly protein SufD [Alphaproteobacteria bacterium]NCT05604.1 Fe-S cluster assembly protein SufD [Alphaproteobacteria bacterium]